MATRPLPIPFGEWLPDLPEHNNPGALIARNVLPELKSYRALNSLASFTDALEDVCLGAFWLQSSDGTVHNFAGDKSKLYRLSGKEWTDVSGGTYTADWWEFANFGDRVIAVNKGNPTQYYDAGSSAAFDDLAGAPQAARVGVVRDFLVLGDVSGLGPNAVKWSGFNNTEAWSPSIATQSDQQILHGRGGRVMRVVPGEYGLIFQEHSIARMDYAGLPVIFQFDEVERKRGTPAPGSVLWAGRHVFYYGWDGFYHFDGTKSDPLSHGRVSQWFTRQVAPDALETMRGAVDRLNRMVIWAFSTGGPVNNRLLIYNWAADKWAYAEVDTEVIEEYASAGYSLDELDSVLDDIDSDSISVDSSAFQGGDINLQAFDRSHRAATFSGDAMTATIDTKELSGQDGRNVFTNSVEPQIESTTRPAIMVQVGKRSSLTRNTEFSPPRGVNHRNGEINVRESARYMRMRVSISGGFTNASGVLVHGTTGGARR